MEVEPQVSLTDPLLLMRAEYQEIENTNKLTLESARFSISA